MNDFVRQKVLNRAYFITLFVATYFEVTKNLIKRFFLSDKNVKMNILQGQNMHLTIFSFVFQLKPNLDAITDEQWRKAKFSIIGLFFLMVIIWSAILISAIFALRINLDNCENCPENCHCRSAPPAWG